MDVKEVIDKVLSLGACDFAKEYLSHCNSVCDMLEFLLTERGIEFCTKVDYPTADVFAGFPYFDWDANNIYSDRGNILVVNSDIVVLVGNTHADIRLSFNKLFRVVLLQGATANITVKNYATVVISKSKSSTVEVLKKDNGIVIYD